VKSKTHQMIERPKDD